MTPLLRQYAAVAGENAVTQLRQLARPLRGMRVVHINSTRKGGGVAEILQKLVPLKRELGMDASWEVVSGDPGFFVTTKTFHNALQGDRVSVTREQLRAYEETSARNAETLRPVLEGADMVFVHDPQPALLASLIPRRSGKWIWRCHIDVSRPHHPVWNYLRPIVSRYDASIFSLAAFAQKLPHPQYLIPPSIDPLEREEHGPQRA